MNNKKILINNKMIKVQVYFLSFYVLKKVTKK